MMASELQKLIKKNRGFYVKMRILHKGRQPEKSLFFRYYQWILWFSFTLYFLTSFFITNKPIQLSKPRASGSKLSLPSRVLFESVNKTSQQPYLKNPAMFKDLKIFIYELPSEYNENWLSNKRCSNHLFASEVAIHRALLNADDFRTFDPKEADFFFVPVYVSCNFSTVNGFPTIVHARSLLFSAIQFITKNYPFWNRSQGFDHIFVASHDYGACFHAMEDRAIDNGIPEFLMNSILLQTFGVNYKHPCQDVENVLIPPYISPESIRKTLEKAPLTGNRDIMVFFRGKMEVHPTNVSGKFYSKRVRTEIWRRYKADRRFYLQRHRFTGYQSEITRSVFCLCPLGWAPWSPRLVESVALGCVPVIIADGIRLPFSSAVKWSEISLTVAEREVGKLGQILEHVAATNLSTIQKNLWDPAVRRALLFNDHMQRRDATWQILTSLYKKLNRSYRRSRVPSQ
ncbi:putative glucuronoxylan glucuronosyltransferase IRX7 -like protein [Gossypium arboreum]|uniref:Putative glucuronoxylan glucuronosyltransferase IRX7-like protein n=1 Tax=Gossypium arboreum TaxID=29729 RepID=A0A0B0NXM5_GOSAR|nr:probable glucuronoxylan glucuronosyltransferase IRX7 isoform X2 [Gossypium arboreum]KHG19243.1 putative glucuronoxylan glucuronosyltransferase IRX7 -like protein [Gossypium arboreum]